MRSALRRTLSVVIVSVMSILLTGVDVGRLDGASAGTPPGTFTVTVRDGMVSLHANKATVMKIVQELAQVTGVTVEGQVEHPEATITVRLERIPVEQVFQHLLKNVAIFSTTDARTGKPRVSRIVLHKEGEGATVSRDDTVALPAEDAAPAPFSFTFDPSQAPSDQ